MAKLFPISTKREDTFIMGESMGGYGTWLTTLLHPEKFGKAVPLSGTNLGALQSKRSAGRINLDELFEKNLKEGKQLTEYYFMCGTEDPGYERNITYIEHIKKDYGIQLKEEYWSGKHDFFFWNQTVPKALQFFGFELDPERVKLV